ncbi:MAG: asparagine synthase (glutamine-hydrolyzing) [Myxococcales bacterium]|nr:asparagine synthase (glutamine-hydrolyzing) [Myxococcales bacterium]MDH5566101.1 asparagine synthase (glutamine-hydrolyzing) [Myxococcales bacterium]
MCGIFGAVNVSGAPLRARAPVLKMGELLRHRGPDGEGCLESAEAILGSRRLSIVDLSAEADQPFASPDGDIWLVCNGEIYNAPALRRRYAAKRYPFRSRHNDVEAILPLYLEHGVDALEQIEGMFALAIWDARERRLLLARDRAGEKPLFFCERSGELRFASEIQVLLSLEASPPELSGEGLSDYLTLGYCTAPRTLFTGIEKLEAAHCLIADARSTRIEPYWNPVAFAAETVESTPEAVLAAFERGVERQVMADVPVGVFTSGGLDSSLLAAEAIRYLPRDSVHTYAVHFESASYDESQWADRVCRDLGTRHHQVSASETELHRALELLSAHMAEPIADPAILPTYLLSEAASQHVRVILSGEGADELFGGYPTYLGHRWAERYARLPAPARACIRAAVHQLPVTRRKVSLEFLARRFVDEAERETFERHIAWFGAHGPDAGRIGRHGKDSTLSALWSRLEGVSHPVKRVMLFDLLTYLAENLLTKVDRATMLASVEARAPYLDRALMELALRQPLSASVGNIGTKLALKRAATARLPRAIVRRRKRGLSVPVSEWINGSLRAEVDALLEPARLRRQEILDPEPVSRLLAEHRAGRADHGRRLWPLFVLQRWHERWTSSPSAGSAMPPA